MRINTNHLINICILSIIGTNIIPPATMIKATSVKVQYQSSNRDVHDRRGHYLGHFPWDKLILIGDG